jgi:hypothetical protein
MTSKSSSVNVEQRSDLDTGRGLPSGIDRDARAGNVLHRGAFKPICRLLLSVLQDKLNDVYIFGSPKCGLKLLSRRCPQQTLRSLIGMVDFEGCEKIVLIRILQTLRATHSQQHRQVGLS